jgi:multicomponent Na+:H+ antiporter subunit F
MNVSLFAVAFILPLLALALVLAFIRLVCGPTLPDRVIAMELISTIVIGLLVTYAVASEEGSYLDVALIVALIAFIGTVSIAYSIERRVRR